MTAQPVFETVKLTAAPQATPAQVAERRRLMLLWDQDNPTPATRSAAAWSAYQVALQAEHDRIDALLYNAPAPQAPAPNSGSALPADPLAQAKLFLAAAIGASGAEAAELAALAQAAAAIASAQTLRAIADDLGRVTGVAALYEMLHA